MVSDWPVQLDAPAWLTDGQRLWLETAPVAVRSIRISADRQLLGEPAPKVRSAGPRLSSWQTLPCPLIWHRNGQGGPRCVMSREALMVWLNLLFVESLSYSAPACGCENSRCKGSGPIQVYRSAGYTDTSSVILQPHTTPASTGAQIEVCEPAFPPLPTLGDVPSAGCSSAIIVPLIPKRQICRHDECRRHSASHILAMSS